jgi:hypothetical protein
MKNYHDNLIEGTRAKLIIGAIIAVIMLLWSVVAKAQEFTFPESNGYIYYEKEQKVDSLLTAPKLHSIANMWLASVFNDSRDAIVLNDKDAAVIMGKGQFVTNIKGMVIVSQILVKFDFKFKATDGAYLITVKNLTGNYVALNTAQSFIVNNGVPPKNAKNQYAWRRNVNDYIQAFIDSFYVYLQRNKGDFIPVKPDEKVNTGSIKW